MPLYCVYHLAVLSLRWGSHLSPWQFWPRLDQRVTWSIVKATLVLGALQLNDDSWRKSTVSGSMRTWKSSKKVGTFQKLENSDFLKLRFGKISIWENTSWPPNRKGKEETDQPALEAFLLTVPDVLTKKTDSSIVKGLDFDSDFLHGPFRSFKNGSSLVPLFLLSFFLENTEASKSLRLSRRAL